MGGEDLRQGSATAATFPSGPAGTGKTTLAFQVAAHRGARARREERRRWDALGWAMHLRGCRGRRTGVPWDMP